jgi:hypothetical protein
MASKLSKVIVAPDQQDLSVGHHALQEGFARGELGGELVRRVDARVDRAPQRFLRGRERFDNFSEADIADDHQIDVAAGALVTAGDRAVNESGTNPIAQRLQRLAQHVRHACRLLEDVAQVLVDRAFGIGLELHLIAHRLAKKNARIGEAIELAEQGARRLADDARDLAHVQRGLRMQQEQR